MEGSSDFGSPMNENKSGKFPQLIKRDPKFRMRPMFGKIVVIKDREFVSSYPRNPKNDRVTKRFYIFWPQLSYCLFRSSILPDDPRLQAHLGNKDSPKDATQPPPAYGAISHHIRISSSTGLILYSPPSSEPLFLPLCCSGLIWTGQLCSRWAGPNFVDNRASSSFLQRRWFNCS